MILTMNNLNSLNSLNFMLKKYVYLTPSYRYVKQKFFKNLVKIDHIAHRSFNSRNFQNLQSFYKNQDFVKMNDIYNFPKLNVTATWMKSKCFRVFLSQYNGDSNFIINNYEAYQRLRRVNDYVAWTYIHQNDINHVAIEVDDIYDIVKKIQGDNKLQLNNSENPIQISKDSNLLQASIVADKVQYIFQDGECQLVPYTFVEFVQRKNNREGFESDNAEQIFKSTNH